jgi:hypothetical protein
LLVYYTHRLAWSHIDRQHGQRPCRKLSSKGETEKKHSPGSLVVWKGEPSKDALDDRPALRRSGFRSDNQNDMDLFDKPKLQPILREQTEPVRRGEILTPVRLAHELLEEHVMCDVEVLFLVVRVIARRSLSRPKAWADAHPDALPVRWAIRKAFSLLRRSPYIRGFGDVVRS